MDVVKALVFDVQGTATDFRTTASAVARQLAADRRPDIDWESFVDDWRHQYRPALDEILAGRRSWSSVDRIYRVALDDLLMARGVTFLSENERERLTFAWQTIEPWPDVVPGLLRLKQRFKLATLSNADVSAVINNSKCGGLPWDAIFAAEMAQTFKPDPRTYRLVLRYLGVEPNEALMVACHKYDLHGAREVGMRTAFVARPLEFGPKGNVDIDFDASFDINVRDFIELAMVLGC